LASMILAVTGRLTKVQLPAQAPRSVCATLVECD
jgi:hypothetical protein